ERKGVRRGRRQQQCPQSRTSAGKPGPLLYRRTKSRRHPHPQVLADGVLRYSWPRRGEENCDRQRSKEGVSQAIAPNAPRQERSRTRRRGLQD
ncbi:hypothetical protein BN1708_020214, partial [Verticillium longisporum]